MAQLTMTTTQFISEAKTQFQTQGAAIRNLEIQVGKIAKQLSDRQQGALPSNTEVNPKQQLMAVTLRNGRELDEVPKQASSKKVDRKSVV